MTRPIRAALPILLLLAPPALGQTSLGQPGNLPPPRPAGQAQPSAPTTAPAAAPKPPTPPARPQVATPSARPGGATSPARPEATTSPARPEAATPARPPAPPHRPPATTPTVQQRPGTSNSPKPATTAAPASPAQSSARKKTAAAAAGAAAGLAGAAALNAARPPEPAQPAAPPQPPAPKVGSATGLPLPRYAALGSNQVNLRIGPDLRYKIEWTYQRKDLPVQIVEEHDIWRRIRDPEGTEGWVQRPLLTSRRTFLVEGAERVLRSRPAENAEAVARLKPGVIGSLRKCDAESTWCEARVGDYRGWIKRSEIWGVTPDEAVN
ncbi:SH3 domain-containing protein [Paracraurococcus lichenis]|uniref:SH3 domain-containing protein n=1 Tax=Paracraurococcus lichenis TaxID=3064888 RepID=A0ABT9E374_9PROT|nr:SH3 domain-containing protein [Paracraurococcus sp. LOR1-02]MDO9710620.1 SH3 domain-containing protein [Paracraurococcus sp. LOR1-02]